MQTLEQASATWKAGAIVQINDGARIYCRPALFVFALPIGGSCWIEPSYLDPNGPGSPAYHMTAGKIENVSPSETGPQFFDLKGGGSWVATAYPADDEDPKDCLESLAAGFAELKRRGATWESERARIADALAIPIAA